MSRPSNLTRDDQRFQICQWRDFSCLMHDEKLIANIFHGRSLPQFSHVVVISGLFISTAVPSTTTLKSPTLHLQWLAFLKSPNLYFTS